MRFRRIGKSNIGDHHWLQPDDQCYYIKEYTSRKDFNYNKTNKLVGDLKKWPTCLDEHEHKKSAILQCSRWLSKAINHEGLTTATLVPVPPSKAKADREYDDRMLRVCEGVCASFPVDMRELVLQRESTFTTHKNQNRNRGSSDNRFNNLYENYRVAEKGTEPRPSTIGIVDDILTTGAHFKAMKLILKKRFPDVPIFGFFITRRIFPDDEVPD